LKLLWTAASMLRKRWADFADLNRCILALSSPHYLMRILRL
jgi:hypothetical protein